MTLPGPGYTPPMFYPPPRKRRFWPYLVVFLAVGVCVLGVVFMAAGAMNTTPSKLLTVPTPYGAPAVGNASPPANDDDDPIQKLKDAGVFTAGDYDLGAKSSPNGGTISAGTYILATPDHCYWARMKSFDGSLDSIIANGNVTADQVVHIRILKSDGGLTLTDNCILTKKKTS